MATQQHQFLPNDCAFQLRYSPNARVLDHRGDWAMRLSKHLELSEWGIIDNRFDVYDKGRTIQATVEFNACGMFMVDVDDHSKFHKKAYSLLCFLESCPEFGEKVNVLRLGVKLRFCTRFSGPFEQLRDHVKDRYCDLKQDGYSVIGNDVELMDVGVPFNFKDEYGEFYTHCGPMRRKQLKEQFFKNREESALHYVGLYYYID